MSRNLWIFLAGFAAIVLLTFTVDPLGLRGTTSRDEADPYGEGDELTGAAGLAGRGRPGEDVELKEYEGDPVGVLDLRLGTSTLRGLVTGEGVPLRLARVRPVLPPPHDNVGVRTRDDGTWEVRGLPAGQFEVRALAPEFVGRTTMAPPVAEDESADVEPIDLRRRPPLTDAIAVKVTDAFGRPMAGSKVLATTMQWDLHLAMGPEVAGIRDVIFKTGTTDELGRVTLGPLPPESYNVVATTRGYTTASKVGIVVSSGRVRHVSLHVLPAATLQGRVVDADGAPLAGASVMGLHQPSWHSSNTAQTDKDGVFELSDLRTGNYMLVAYHEEGGTVMSPGKAPSGGVTLKLGGTGVIEGTVARADGTPVADAKVRPFRMEWFGYHYSTVASVDENGAFRIHLPNGEWHLRVQAADGNMTETAAITVAIGETATADVTLPVSGVVRGVVTDEAGNHVTGAEVFVRMGSIPPTKSREQYAKTNDEGRFEVTGLAIEPVVLKVNHPHYGNTEFQATPAAPGQATEVTVKMGSGARIHGHVRNADGRPVAGEQINMILSFFEAHTTFCDDEGYYAFDHVAEGKYSLSTGPFEPGARGTMKSGIVVGPTGDVVVDFQASAATGVVTGSVGLAGKPMAGAVVSVVDERGLGYIVSTTTDEQGLFRAEGLQPGRVTVNVQTADGSATQQSATLDAERGTVEVKIEMGASVVRGRIVDAERRPLSGVWVFVEATGGEESGYAWSRIKAQKTTGGDGVFAASGLSAARYVVRISSSAHAQYLSEEFDVAQGETKDVGDIVLKRGAILSGRVTDDANAPIEDATVSLRDANGREVFLFSTSTTGSDGRYMVQGLEPGRYTVRFEAAGHAFDERPIDLAASGTTLDGTLQRGGTITVTVEDEAGHPLRGARLKLLDSAGRPVTKTLSLANLFESQQSITSAEGKATVRDLASGTYRVSAVLDGYVAGDTEVRVYLAPGGVQVARVVLRAE